MKKILVIACLVSMVLALSVGANAYIFKAKLTGADGTGGAEVSFGDVNTSSQAWVAPVGEYCSLAAKVADVWKVRDFQKPAPERFSAYAWSTTGYAQESGILKFYLSTEGNESTTGSVAAGQKWGVWGPDGKLITSGVVNGVGSATNPVFSITMPLIKTSTPLADAACYQFGVVTPEPGSMVAMLSGLVGLVGFGIRRRK